MAYHFLDSKLDRALVAYLVEEGAATNDNCWPALRALDKELPNVTVHTTDLLPNDGDLFSGSRIADVEIIISQHAVPDNPESEPAASNAARLAFNALVGGVCDALNKHGQSGDLLADAINEAAYALATADEDNHSDLTHFAVDAVEHRGESQGFLADSGIWQKTVRMRFSVLAQRIDQ